MCVLFFLVLITLFAYMVANEEEEEYNTTTIIVKTKATTRNEEEQTEIKIGMNDTMATLRRQVWLYCHVMDVVQHDFSEDIMATTNMNVVLGGKKVGTTKSGDNHLMIGVFMAKYNLEFDSDWYLQLPMTVDFGGGT